MAANRALSPDAFDVFHAGSNVDAYLTELDAGGEEQGRVHQVPIEAVHTAPWQPRRHDDAARIAELVASIRANGLLHPITVRPLPSSGSAPTAQGYEVIAGHRRLAALTLLSEERVVGVSGALVPVMIKHLDDLAARILTHTENAARDDLSPWESAQSIANVRDALRDAHQPHTVRVVAPLVNCAEGPTSEYLKIADEITEDALLAAGAVVNGQVDYSLVCRLSHGQLLAAAKALAGAERQSLLADAIADPRARKRKTPSGRQKHDAPAAAREGEEVAPKISRAPRYTREGLMRRGGFMVKLSKPFKNYSPEEARTYLQDLLPAVAALADVEQGVNICTARPAGDGFLVYMSKNPMKVRTQEERKALLESLEAIRNSLLRDYKAHL